MKWVGWVWVLALLVVGSHAQDMDIDLAELTLEELMDVEIFSVSRKEERLGASAAAVFVITPEEMRRAGVTSIPEALRLVPGMEVARLDASKWAVSARGFNDIFSNKLLVLIDGRSVYTPLFSGVFWDTQDVMLEDVEQIEVIRGPGATLWGANAVNGIINVLTKSARDTQGGLVSAAAGSEERGLVGARYGGRVGDRLFWRVFTRHAQRDHLVSPAGEPAADGWDVGRAGFRVDWEEETRDALTLQGEIYDGTIGGTFQIIDTPEPPYERTFGFDTPISGGHLLARWERRLGDDADLALQGYFDRTERGEAPISGYLDTWDLDFQHRFALDSRQEIVWGLGYRLIRDDMEGSFSAAFVPGSRTYDLLSAFAQDEIELVANRLWLTLGSKVEYGDFSGLEVQPNGRLLWTPAEGRTVWGAVSRAVRTPARSDHDLRSVFGVVPAGQFTLATFFELQGNPGFASEELISLEAGYRTRLMDYFFLDLTAFTTFYDQLLTVEPGLPYPDSSGSHLLAPVVLYNRMSGRTWGMELAGECRLRGTWRLRAAYTLLKMRIDLDEDSRYAAGLGWDGVSPQHQFSLRSSLDLPSGWELDLWGRYVDDLPYVALDGYFDLDVRLGWKVNDRLEISLVGQDLLDDQRAEFSAPHSPTLNSEAQRGAYGALRLDF